MAGDQGDARISNFSGLLLIAMAMVIDAVQILLTFAIIGFVINPFISICTTILFSIWLSHLGVRMLSPKHAIRMVGTVVGETIFGTLPIWTFSIAFVVAQSKVKDIISTPIPRRGGWRL